MKIKNIKLRNNLLANFLAIAFILLIAPVGQALAVGQDKVFDHFTTGFPLVGAHRNTECATCHLYGVFKGIPSNCSSCHSKTSRISATAKSSAHITTTDSCDSCHLPNNWNSVTRVNHNHVKGTCTSCHNNRLATGKTSTHIPTSFSCETCHSSNQLQL